MAHKIIEGAKQALEAAKCDHELIPQPEKPQGSRLDRFYCPKCKATIYQQKPARRRS